MTPKTLPEGVTKATLEQIAARAQERIAKGGLTTNDTEGLKRWVTMLLEWHDDKHTPTDDELADVRSLWASLDELDRRDAPAPAPAPAGAPIAPARGKPPAKAPKAASGPSDALKPDLEQAGRFIAALTGKSGTAVTFQTFDDGPKPGRAGLVQVLHGALDQHAETLTELNGRGAGVYITINTTDGTGRKAKNIKAIRALFADFDATDAVERALAATRKLAPSIVVESSPGKRHLYWLAEGVEVKDAASINKALAAEVGADKVHDIARVLRLPGFFHRKGAPVMSRLLETHPEHRYSGAQVVEAFSLHPGEPSAASDVHAPAAGLDGVLSDQQVADARAVIAAMREKKMHLSAKGRGVKGGTGLWHQVVGSLAPYGKPGAQLAHEFSEGDPTYSPALVVSTIKTKLKNGATGIGALFKLAEAHGIANPAAGRNAGASFDAFYSEVPQEVRPGEPTAAPLEWPPGLVGEIARYILESSRLPVPSFAIAGALTAASYLVQNLSRVAPSDTPLNLYQVLIGGTGRGKEDPRKAIKRIVNSPELTHLSAGISESMSSGSALLRALSHAPRALILSDEYGMFMQSAMQGRDDHRRDFVKELMTLYGQGSSFYAGKVYADAKNNIGRIDFPYVVVLGTTTEEELFAGMNMQAINNGSANRNVYVYADAADPKPNRSPCTAIPPALAAKLSDVFGDNPRSGPLEYGPGAEELVVEFGDNLPKTGVFANLWSRAEENAIRVAGVLAVCDGRVITANHVRWAIRYIRASIEQFAGKSEHQISESDFHKSSNRVLGFIAAPMKYSDDKQFSSFTRRGLMPKGKLLKLTHMRARDLDDVLTALLESQQIASNKQDGSTVFWVGNSQPVEETPTQ